MGTHASRWSRARRSRTCASNTPDEWRQQNRTPKKPFGLHTKSHIAIMGHQVLHQEEDEEAARRTAVMKKIRAAGKALALEKEGRNADTSVAEILTRSGIRSKQRGFDRDVQEIHLRAKRNDPTEAEVKS